MKKTMFFLERRLRTHKARVTLHKDFARSCRDAAGCGKWPRAGGKNPGGWPRKIIETEKGVDLIQRQCLPVRNNKRSVETVRFVGKRGNLYTLVSVVDDCKPVALL